MQLDALDFMIDACSRAARSPLAEDRGEAHADWQDAGSRRGSFPGVPVDPAGVPTRLTTRGACTSRPTSPLYPLPDEPQHLGRSRLMMTAACPVVVAALVRRAHRQFPQRLHLPAAARAVDRLAGSACGSCGHALLVRKHSRRQLPALLRGRCRACRAPISIRYPIVEAADRASCSPRPGGSTGRASCSSSRLVFGCALIVLFAIDLEHHLLPNVITLPGIVVGFRLQLHHAARVARRRSSASSSAAVCCGRLPRATTGSATKKASGWATSRCSR